ncbi:MAG TPA: iron donor protein CyaY [Magnetospirillaceae bacterium]
MSLSESAFHPLADEALNEIALAIETHLDDRLDVELQQGILTIDLEGGGQYVINKHAPNRQIWLSSPRSGAWHFASPGPGSPWTSTRDGSTTLGSLLREEFGAATGVYIELSL